MCKLSFSDCAGLALGGGVGYWLGLLVGSPSPTLVSFLCPNGLVSLLGLGGSDCPRECFQQDRPVPGTVPNSRPISSWVGALIGPAQPALGCNPAQPSPRLQSFIPGQKN